MSTSPLLLQEGPSLPLFSPFRRAPSPCLLSRIKRRRLSPRISSRSRRVQTHVSSPSHKWGQAQASPPLPGSRYTHTAFPAPRWAKPTPPLHLKEKPSSRLLYRPKKQRCSCLLAYPTRRPSPRLLSRSRRRSWPAFLFLSSRGTR